MKKIATSVLLFTSLLISSHTYACNLEGPSNYGIVDLGEYHISYGYTNPCGEVTITETKPIGLI